jgi:hypothetical protein
MQSNQKIITHKEKTLQKQGLFKLGSLYNRTWACNHFWLEGRVAEAIPFIRPM